MKLHLDFETCSRSDLKKTGASKYAQDPSTKVLCLAYAFDDDPVKSIILPTLKDIHWLFRRDIHCVLCAWNASFELAILKHVYGAMGVDPRLVSCTMQRALHYGLPGRLELAAPAIGAKHHKDMAGHRLMLSMSRPRPKLDTFWHEDQSVGLPKLKELAVYCEKDVEAERAISNRIPELPGPELDVSYLDRETNEYGLKIDIPLVERMINIAVKETWRLDTECAYITGNRVTSPGTQTDRLLTWLWAEGVELNDVSKESVQQALDLADVADFTPAAIKVLAIRQKVAKSSVRKLQAMLNSVEADGRIRGTLQYYGAGRTGRFAGRLVQPQNFPRIPKGFSPKSAIAAMMLLGSSNDMIRAFHGEPLSVVSYCLRSCIVPSARHKFLRYDLAQIEARVLAWLADQQDVLDEFEAGHDVYDYTARKIGLNSRDAGKVAVLGLGYGMGTQKFIEFAKTYGLILDEEEAHRIVTDWRQANSHIVDYWYALDRAVNDMLLSKVGKPLARQVGDCIFYVSHIVKTNTPMLFIELPSGRTLYYHNIRTVPVTEPGKRKWDIVFDGINMAKQWASIRTWGAKLAENITQATARDIIVQAALRVSHAAPGAKLVLSVHDELLFEVPEKDADNLHAAIEKLITLRPNWAKTLPIAVEGQIMERYGK